LYDVFQLFEIPLDKSYRLNTLRHTFVSVMKNNGVKDSWIKEIIGHKQDSRVMDEHYFTFDKNRF